MSINMYRAASSVAAGVPCAFIDLDLAAGASESRATGTGVAALASIATSGSIQTGLVMCAVVQIWREGSTHMCNTGISAMKTAAHGSPAAGQLDSCRLCVYSSIHPHTCVFSTVPQYPLLLASFLSFFVYGPPIAVACCHISSSLL